MLKIGYATWKKPPEKNEKLKGLLVYFPECRYFCGAILISRGKCPAEKMHAHPRSL
jgi:hypothetical protein